MLKIKHHYQHLSLKFKVTVIFLIAFLAGASAYLLQPKPDLTFYQTYSTVIFDSNNKLLRVSLAQDERYRIFTPLKEIAKSLQQATIMYEDKDYYQHSGVDYPALIRAFWQTYVLKERRIGASTIVMQVARLRWGIQSNTASGKIEQIFRALQLARHYSKNELLEAYLNLAPYGGNIEGIGAASLIYFNKPASQLSLAEALTLAVVPQNPSKRKPSNIKGMLALQPAKQSLVERWKIQYPSDASLLNAMALPLSVRKASSLPYNAQHFVQYILAARSRAQARHGGIVKSTLNLDLQNRMDKALQSYVGKNKSRGFNNASALLINTKTMHIEAMIGSADFNNLDIHGQVNGTIAKRSPGSTLKPFVYGLALDAGLIHPMTMLQDLPKRYAGFAPENFGHGFVGPISAQDALISSRNVPAVDLQSRLLERKASLLTEVNAQVGLNLTTAAKKVKNRTFYEFLNAAGISQLKEADFYGLALVLGGVEITMLELAELYAMIANFGSFRSVVSTDWVSAHDDLKTELKLLSAESSYLIFDILSKNPRPDSVSRADSNRTGIEQTKVAWKTGTSWAFRDAWAIGISGDYVLAVWVGNFDGQGNHSFIGRTAAGPLLFKLLDVALISNPSNSPAYVNSDSAVYQPTKQHLPFDDNALEQLNVKLVDICTSTGDLYASECPSPGTTLFIPGVSPIKNSNIYRNVWIDKNTGLRACSKNSVNAMSKVFAFWPTDFQRLFEQAGVFIDKPPAFDKKCNTPLSVSVSSKPSIYSPQQGIEYVLQDSMQSYVVIPLQANADADASRLHWFANNNYIGSIDLSTNNDDSTLWWQAKAGNYEVQVSDDLGRSSVVLVKVKAVK